MIGEKLPIGVSMNGVLEKFDGDWKDGDDIPREYLRERLTIENDKVVKKETFDENGKLVQTEDYV